ncbi:MAG: hypothetical protein IRZ16_21980 [Myxococcaceae bacterium]|nr:hypothetical protein [Myxococcaceae bacterium]
MRHKHPDDNSLASQKADETHELTGADAPREQAETGSAGNGASPFDEDFAGVEFDPPPDTFEEEYRFERNPSHAEDIGPDKIEKGFEEPGAEDREYSAQPSEPLRPVTPDLLPSDDPGAREK